MEYQIQVQNGVNLHDATDIGFGMDLVDQNEAIFTGPQFAELFKEMSNFFNKNFVYMPEFMTKDCFDVEISQDGKNDIPPASKRPKKDGESCLLSTECDNFLPVKETYC